ncbi:NADP-dependent oxidoreductase [Haladaptatus sp. DYF46]|uniref:NADP-dependent oxidoreductase n=1 Tax=Haladaptatus sp. DYF46 TaxID=2886041 RepID=UPI001E5A29A5|nr:NADP-dependent oxidoreductase [Haladaptatus sp. DYF46]
MKAVRVHEFGDVSNLRYEEIETSEPAADEVRVRIHAAGVNPVDYKIRQGAPFPIDLPWIPGWDIAGVVDEVGTDVSGFELGEEVYGILPFPGDGGAYAEAVTISPTEGKLGQKPASLSFEEAAAVPMAGLTAWRSMQLTDLQAGQRILIHAAAGGVGHFAVQFAKHRGAHVIGTASGSNEEFLRDLGVDEFVNYREERFEDAVEPVDVVIDAIGGDTFTRSLEIVKESGVIDNLPLNLTPEQEAAADGHGVRLVQADTFDRNWLEDISEFLDDGTVAPTLDTVFPLAEARHAHELSEEGHVRGKIVLKTSDGDEN